MALSCLSFLCLCITFQSSYPNYPRTINIQTVDGATATKVHILRQLNTHPSRIPYLPKAKILKLKVKVLGPKNVIPTWFITVVAHVKLAL